MTSENDSDMYIFCIPIELTFSDSKSKSNNNSGCDGLRPERFYNNLLSKHVLRYKIKLANQS